MSVALYRKYRSKSLDEIVGQSHVTDVLRRALTSGKIAHAYLLTGPRGVGKTSIARILAHEINGLEYTDDSEHLDIIEIDAASNNGVDDVRELREKALIAPARAAKKVYIIDEVHMLSKPAFNALLKILEEPPEHIVFILATTDFDKLPDTIVSRTQRYHFHTISENDVVQQLRLIAESEKIQIEESALKLLAQRGGGSLRDSVSLLDQIQHSRAEFGLIERSDVEVALGLATSEELSSLVSALTQRQPDTIITSLQAVTGRGVSAPTLASQLVQVVSRQLATTPTLVHFLEGLMEVGKSSYPETKLLVTLLAQTVEKPKTVAQRTSAPTPILTITPSQPVKVPTVAPVKRQKPAVTASPTLETKKPEIAAASTQQPIDMSKFDWQAVLSYAQQNHTALYAILSKCTPAQDGDKLILYAGRKFNKTKLDSAKYRPLINECLEHTGAGSGVEIEILDTSAPPKDSQAAAIADMMGGGEEVDVE
ncbi:DNA polymerase III subunit gamma/tau [Candidatus Saccharibacteria bacterium]|nr:DNA polymerase III subunit gamma/tau [Candidatus Saccharibacteria bacterium]